MNQLFTSRLQRYLSTPPPLRDLEEGNLLLLQLSANRVRYRYFATQLPAKAKAIEYELQRYLRTRLTADTHRQVEQMQQQVAQMKVLDDHAAENAAWRKGKRADHDRLPEAVQALYAENLGIVQRMRHVHLRLSDLSRRDLPCPDSERFPFLKELIDLDRRLHANWQAYDQAEALPNPPATQEE